MSDKTFAHVFHECIVSKRLMTTSLSFKRAQSWLSKSFHCYTEHSISVSHLWLQTKTRGEKFLLNRAHLRRLQFQLFLHNTYHEAAQRVLLLYSVCLKLFSILWHWWSCLCTRWRQQGEGLSVCHASWCTCSHLHTEE